MLDKNHIDTHTRPRIEINQSDHIASEVDAPVSGESKRLDIAQVVIAEDLTIYDGISRILFCISDQPRKTLSLKE